MCRQYLTRRWLCGEITLGSLFDGIGGFPYAASFYGIRTLWASEVMADCISVTRRHFPEMGHAGDITQLHGGRLPPVDVITFGSPCQGLSLAGKRLGLADERSGLFLEAARVIFEMREATHGRYPRFALWENVPGALYSAGGHDFKAVLETLTEGEVPMPRSGKWANAGMVRGGGADVAWCVYDAQYFGTAQRRRRVFLVMDFGEKRAGEILFVPRSLQGYFEAGGTPGQGASAFAGGGTGRAGGGGGSLNGNGMGDDRVYCIVGNTIGRKPWNGAHGLGCQRELSYTLTTVDRHAVTAPAIAMRMRSGCEGGGKGSLLQIEKSGTLVTGNDQYLFEPGGKLAEGQDGDSLPAGRGYVARRLTPLECERLQGFPDNWTRYRHDGKEIGDTRRYEMLGNSIAVPCAAYIMQGMCQALAGDDRQGVPG